MRVVVQRVNKAKVFEAEIGKGLFVLLGIKKGDGKKQADILVEKLCKLRVMADQNNKMNLTVEQVEGAFMVVSQFTLYGDTSGGNRPSFIDAEEPEKAKELYEYFVERLEAKGVVVKTGKFGEYMDIEASLDGPVTIILEA